LNKALPVGPLEGLINLGMLDNTSAREEGLTFRDQTVEAAEDTQSHDRITKINGLLGEIHGSDGICSLPISPLGHRRNAIGYVAIDR
jgi:hypothetical protein